MLRQSSPILSGTWGQEREEGSGAVHSRHQGRNLRPEAQFRTKSSRKPSSAVPDPHQIMCNDCHGETVYPYIHREGQVKWGRAGMHSNHT